MKRYKSHEHEKNSRICGTFDDAPLKIARAVTSEVLEKEKMHNHEGYEFYIFLKGKAELEVEGAIISVKEGDVILIEAGENHKVANIFEEIDCISIKDSRL